MSIDYTNAFPAGNEILGHGTGGMDLRDWFAGQYLAGTMACESYNQGPEAAAEYAYKYADAMMEQRKRPATERGEE
jgi:hypothetical protein